MKLYQAPLEGITGYIYRKVLFEVFGGVDKYFAPFISPYEKRIISDKEKNQLCPEHNSGYVVVPQILSMDGTGTVELMNWLNINYGYEEFNLNFGCPSGTVVSKGRGAGALDDLERLKEYLDTVFSFGKYRISIKTRLGLHNSSEFEDIMGIYNQYELEELIVHPRIKDELYKGNPHYDIYREIQNGSKNILIYNGNISTVSDYERVKTLFDNKTCGVMIGRGMVANPSIFREIKGGKSMDEKELTLFLHSVLDEYLREFSGEVPVLHKMKEIWIYLGNNLVDNHNVDERLIKKLVKSKNINEYKAYEREAISQYKKGL